MVRSRIPASAAGALIVLGAATACSSSDSSSTSASAGAGASGNLKVVYLEAPPGHNLTDLFTAAKTQFEKDNPGSTVTLQAMNATETDFYTKVALMQRSPSTAPDLVYEDSFQVNADASAGYLEPLDEMVKSWSDWSLYPQPVRAAGTAADGKLYGIPLATDTQGLWYNRQVFKRAGLPERWQPKTWGDILTAARAVAKLGGVTPINIYTTKAQGEAATLRGVQNLVSGTPGGLGATFYDAKSGKWVTGSTGMRDALDFLHTAYQEKLLPPVNQMENPQLWSWANNEAFPAGKLAMMIDGNWIHGGWEPKAKGGTNPWPTWTRDAGFAAIPTQTGQAPSRTTMSGGWTMAVGSKGKHKALAFKYLQDINTKANNLAYVLGSGNLPVRDDVRQDPSFTSSNPASPFFAKLVDVTNFRPALPVYPQVSNLVQQAAEDVTIGGKSATDAQATYDAGVKSTVGDDKTTQGS